MPFDIVSIKRHSKKVATAGGFLARRARHEHTVRRVLSVIIKSVSAVLIVPTVDSFLLSVNYIDKYSFHLTREKDRKRTERLSFFVFAATHHLPPTSKHTLNHLLLIELFALFHKDD